MGRKEYQLYIENVHLHNPDKNNIVLHFNYTLIYKFNQLYTIVPKYHLPLNNNEYIAM